MSTISARLHRTDSNTSWGFRMAGGKDFGTPLAIQRVTPGSLAAKCGVQTGDHLIRIGDTVTEGLRHKEAQQVIILAGNSLVLTLQRGGAGMNSVPVQQPQYAPAPTQSYTPQQPSPNAVTNNYGHQPHHSQLDPNEYQNFNNCAQPWQGVAPTLPAHQYNPYQQTINDTAASFNNMHIGQPSGPGRESPSPPPLPSSGPPGSIPRLSSNSNLYIGASDTKPMGNGSSPAKTSAYAPVKFSLDGYNQTNGEVKASNNNNNKGMHDKNNPTNTNMAPLKPLEISGTRPLPPSLSPKQTTSSTNYIGTSWYSPGGRPTSSLSPGGRSTSSLSPGGRSTSSLSPRGGLSPNKQEASPSPKAVGPSPTLAAVLSEKEGKGVKSKSEIRGLASSNTQSRSFNFLRDIVDSGKEMPNTRLTNDDAGKQYNSPINLYSKQNTKDAPDNGHIHTGKEDLLTSSAVQSATFSTSPNPNATNLPTKGMPPGVTSVKSRAFQTLQNKLNDASYNQPKAPTPAPVYNNPPSRNTAPVAPAAPAPKASSWQPRIPSGPRKMRVMKAGAAKSMPSGGGMGGRIPLCSNCNMQIRGPFVLALDKSWCPDHFSCSNPNCSAPLVDTGFVEEDGQLFCERDYEQYFAPRCHKCGNAIMGDCINALKETFHPQCFTCHQCHQSIGSGSFHIEEGKTYCEKDWQAMFQTKCYGCQFPIEPGDRWVEALNENWHSECFNCSSCQVNLEGQQFFAKAGKPFCKRHAMGR